MNTISINLLPEELRSEAHDKIKKSVVFKVTIAVLVLMILITGGVILQVILKNSENSSTNNDLQQAESSVGALKEQEGYLTLLEQRLSIVANLSNLDSKQISNYSLITGFVPAGVSILSVDLAKSGDVSITGQTKDNSSLRALLDNLFEANNSSDKISKVKIDSLSLSQDGTYRFDLTAVAK